MSKIQLDANASGTGVFTIASPSGNTDRTVTLPDSDGEFVLSASGTISDFASTGIDDNATSTAITIDSDENVGIGIAPSSTFGRLRVGDSNSDIAMDGNAKGQFHIDGNGYAFGIALNADGAQIYTNSSARSIIFGTNETERVRVDGNGNVLVGKSSTSTTTAGGEINADGTLVGVRDGGNSLVLNRLSSNGAIASFRKDGTIVGSISVTGSATSYNTSSDYRLKENVVDLDNGIDRLKQIPVHRFNFIADPDTTVDGFIAHEVQDVVPEAITGAKDAVDDEGNPEYQGIDQSKLVPLLTAALQEAVAKIEDLESRLSALETN